MRNVCTGKVCSYICCSRMTYSSNNMRSPFDYYVCLFHDDVSSLDFTNVMSVSVLWGTLHSITNDDVFECSSARVCLCVRCECEFLHSYDADVFVLTWPLANKQLRAHCGYVWYNYIYAYNAINSNSFHSRIRIRFSIKWKENKKKHAGCILKCRSMRLCWSPFN